MRKRNQKREKEIDRQTNIEEDTRERKIYKHKE
jgi:hypothetical protein